MVPPPSQMAPPTSSQTQNAPYTPAYHPQFANATPFMPRSGLSYPPPPGSSLPPPPTSTIPPPPVGQPSSEPGASPLPQEPSSTHSHFTGPHSRAGITAAQLYSLNVIGSGRRSLELDDVRRNPGFPPREPISRRKRAAAARSPERHESRVQSRRFNGQPQKASNSNDLINLNRIPHPEEDASLRSYSWKEDDDWISVGFPVSPEA